MGVKKVLISLDEDLLERIDAVVAETGESRSAYVARTVSSLLPDPELVARRREAFREIRKLVREAAGREDPNDPVLDAATEVRRMRDERGEHIERVVDEAFGGARRERPNRLAE